VAHDFNNFATERPLEDVLNFGHEGALQVLQLELRQLLLPYLLIEILILATAHDASSRKILHHLRVRGTHGPLVDEVVRLHLINRRHLSLQLLLLLQRRLICPRRAARLQLIGLHSQAREVRLHDLRLHLNLGLLREP
jgi:hypothetical protein